MFIRLGFFCLFVCLFVCLFFSFSIWTVLYLLFVLHTSESGTVYVINDVYLQYLRLTDKDSVIRYLSGVLGLCM